MTLLGQLVVLVPFGALCVLGAEGCSAPSARPRGPEPVYEPPQLGPRDAGVRTGTEDPFAAAAQSEWLDEPEDGGRDGPSEADGAARDGAVSLDASQAIDLH